MAALITGGASLIGTKLAYLLKAAGRPVLFASRSGNHIPEGFSSVKFDWYDASTFANPFEVQKVDSVYILPPLLDLDPITSVAPFIDLAIAQGVKRFVLLSTTSSERLAALDKYGIIKIHKYLNEKGVDYVVIRPTWFVENFDRLFGYGIRGNSQFQTFVSTGKIPFVAAQDIAQAAYEALTNEKNAVAEKIVLGPELLTYDQAAEILSEVLGRKITHKVVTQNDIAEQLKGVGLPPNFIDSMIGLHSLAQSGSEEKFVEQLKPEEIHVGTVTVRAWAEENKALLQPTV